nr:hypothetical protein [Tanacetum cinerariifolium]
MYLQSKVEEEKDLCVMGRKLNGLAIDDLVDLRKGSKSSRLESLKQKKQATSREGSSDAHNKYYESSDNHSETTLYSSSSDKTAESANETNDVDESNTDLSNDNSNGYDNVAGYGEMFPDKNAHHLSSPPSTKTSYPTKYPQPSSLKAKAKKLLPKAKKNIRKINFKKAVAQKFIEYDHKLEALTNFNRGPSKKKEAIQIGLVKSDHLKWNGLDDNERDAYNQLLSKLQSRTISLLKYNYWVLLENYRIKEELDGLISISFKDSEIGELECYALKRA